VTEDDAGFMCVHLESPFFLIFITVNAPADLVPAPSTS